MVNDPDMVQFQSNFGSMLTNILGLQPGPNRGFPTANNPMGTGFGMFGFPGAGPPGGPNTFTATARIYPRGPGGPNTQTGSFNE